MPRLLFSLFCSAALLNLFLSRTASAADSPPADVLQVMKPENLKELLKPVPPLPLEEAMKAIQIAPGFHIELVATEPLVCNPSAAAIDENGRMYVCELIDYPYRPKTGEPPKGRVRVLEDTDGDGRYDKSAIFAEGLLWTAGVACWKGGVYVTAPPDIWYMKDNDGDGKADVKEKVYTGFGVSGAQYILNNLQWGLDHQIYASVAGNGGRVKRVNDPPENSINANRRDIRFSPATGAIEAISGSKQFGNTFDDWGNRFLCSESSALIHVVLPLKYLDRNPFLRSPEVKNTIVGGPTPIFRASPVEAWRAIRSARRLALNEREPTSAGLSHHVLDAVAGIAIYRGDAYPESFRGNLFVPDAQNNLIHHRSVVPDGVTFKSERVGRESEFIRSSDNWFRPVNLVHAPDGTLYALDLAREILEAVHIPLDVVQYLDLTSGRDKGRIYRIAPDGFKAKPPPHLGDAKTEELVALLESRNGWTRDTAHRLIYERQDKSAEAPLRRILERSPYGPARLHALWSLDGLGVLTDADLEKAMADAGAGVRERAIELSEPRISHSPDLLLHVLGLANDPAPRVRFQAALTLGETTDPRAIKALAQIARRDAEDAWTRAAILSAPPQRAESLLSALVENRKFVPLRGAMDWFGQLAYAIGARNQPAELARAIKSLKPRPTEPVLQAAQETIVLGLGEGLTAAGSSLMKMQSALDKPEASRLKNILAQAAVELKNPFASVQDRLRVIKLLGHGSFDSAAELSTLLIQPEPEAEQVEAVRALSRFDDPKVGAMLLAPWRSATPKLRSELIAAITAHSERIGPLLDALESGSIMPSEIPALSRNALTHHSESAISDRAGKLFNAVQSSRAEVITKFKPALDLKGDAEKGHSTYARLCIACHHIGNEGNVVGPNLALETKHADELLTAILDPNEEVHPEFIQYTVTEKSGGEFNGIIASETDGAVTLRRQNEEKSILRSNMKEMSSSKLSLMPEGLEQDLSLQDMADLLAFLLGTQYDRGTSGVSSPEK